MKKINALRVFILLTALSLSATSNAQQVGVVFNGVYYSVNPSLPNDTIVQILPENRKRPAHCCSTISGRANKKDNDGSVIDMLRDRKVWVYTLSMPHDFPTDIAGFGIVVPARWVRVETPPEAVLDDGDQVVFSTCTSAEGVHYLGRRITDRKLLVHLYWHFEGELETTCNGSDFDVAGKVRK